ncbi:hypothetical protein [Phaeobacter sp.]|uniref:hypothetical protein n=1 Tax=Phaeobacter sp. TaxID=1902409 RepID=UPI0025F12632|nr:hypothetical protein [Phaeobacter sp.]
MPFVIAAVLLVAFVANVVTGAVGDAPFVGIVSEMLILFGAAIAFSVGILRSEAHANSKDKSSE